MPQYPSMPNNGRTFMSKSKPHPESPAARSHQMRGSAHCGQERGTRGRKSHGKTWKIQENPMKICGNPRNIYGKAMKTRRVFCCSFMIFPGKNGAIESAGDWIWRGYNIAENRWKILWKSYENPKSVRISLVYWMKNEEQDSWHFIQRCQMLAEPPFNHHFR